MKYYNAEKLLKCLNKETDFEVQTIEFIKEFLFVLHCEDFNPFDCEELDYTLSKILSKVCIFEKIANNALTEEEILEYCNIY